MAVRTRAYGAASVVMTIFAIVAAILVISILLVLVGANERNTLVDLVLDVGRFFAQPFDQLIPQDGRRQNMVINWGIGAIAYLIVGSLLARLISRA
jgi:hypothetical protein